MDRHDQAVRRELLAVFIYIAIHSLFASKQMKDLVERKGGERVRKGLYRPLFALYAMVGGALVFREVKRPPNKTIYRVPPPFSWLMRLGQIFMLLVTLDAVRVTGPAFFGIPQLRAYLRKEPIEYEPEAQGPPPRPDDEMANEWIFNYTRHPNNWGPTSYFILEPHMTVKQALFCVITLLHGLLGSIHEEYRLKARYGDAYTRYKKKVPFFVKLPR